MADLKSAVTAFPTTPLVSGAPAWSSNEPSPLLVHNLGWSSSESFQSPRRRTCLKGFPETGSNVGEGHGGQEIYFAVAIIRTPCDEVSLFRTIFWKSWRAYKLCKDLAQSQSRVSNRQAGANRRRELMKRVPQCKVGVTQRGCSEAEWTASQLGEARL